MWLKLLNAISVPSKLTKNRPSPIKLWHWCTTKWDSTSKPKFANRKPRNS